MNELDRVDSLLFHVERQLRVAWDLTQRHGTAPGVESLHSAMGLLLEAVKELAKRNDPLAAEKAEAASWARLTPENGGD